jgi:hypothetical protein
VYTDDLRHQHDTKTYRTHHTVRPTQQFNRTILVLGIGNYFRDHIPQHSLVAQPLHAMVSVAAKAKQKQITWTEEGRRAFSTLKSLVNKCPKLYFIDTKLPIILYTDASDYTHGAYLCQVQKHEDSTTVELPITKPSVEPRSGGLPSRRKRLSYIGP